METMFQCFRIWSDERTFACEPGRRFSDCAFNVFCSAPLAMKTQGCLRNEHSQAMAQKVKF